MLADQRRDPAASFAGLTRQPPWDDFQVAYFAGEANWNYFAAPFILARSDFVAEEKGPWHEDGQVWRSLLITCPDTIVAHCRSRPTTSTTPGCCGAPRLRRRHPGRRPCGALPVGVPRVLRDHGPDQPPGLRPQPDGSPVLDSVSIAIDVTAVTFN